MPYVLWQVLAAKSRKYHVKSKVIASKCCKYTGNRNPKKHLQTDPKERNKLTRWFFLPPPQNLYLPPQKHHQNKFRLLSHYHPIETWKNNRRHINKPPLTFPIFYSNIISLFFHCFPMIQWQQNQTSKFGYWWITMDNPSLLLPQSFYYPPCIFRQHLVIAHQW